MSAEPEVSVSLVMEWENAALTEATRVASLLRRIRLQVHELRQATGHGSGDPSSCAVPGRIRYPIEIVIAFNQSLDEARLKARILEIMGEEDREFRLTFCSTPEQRYFELKNAGANASKGDIVVFLDSDVIPQAHWLATLLSSFSDPEISIVGSNCFVEHRTLYQKSYAAIKFGEPFSGGGIVASYTLVHGNSMAFRRWAFDRYNFPPTGFTYKLPFKYFIETLRRDRFPVYVNLGAQVEHPAPLPKNFLKRGFFHGRDEMILRQERRQVSRSDGPESASTVTYWGAREYRLAASRLLRIMRLREKWQIALWELPLVYCIVAAYYSAVLAGYLVTKIWPGFSRRRFDYLTMLE